MIETFEKPSNIFIKKPEPIKIDPTITNNVPIGPDSSQMEIEFLNDELVGFPNKIDKALQLEINAEEKYKNDKQKYENKYYQIMLNLKAADDKVTQTDLKASAKTGSHQERMDMIVSESAYRRAKADTKKLENEFKSLQEKCYNFRAQLKRFGG